MAPPPLSRLAQALHGQRLLTDEQLAAVDEMKPPDQRALARELLQRGWVTGFQLQQIAQGREADLVLGPYLLLDELGSGGVGRVYRARHRSTGQVVALKVIRKEMLDKPNALRRFQREMQAIDRLDHPNLITAYDACRVGDTHFLVMEYADGADLAKHVRDEGPLPVGVACDYIRQAALGLQFAHEQGVVHRDVKPHNLLLTTDGVIKVLDLGMAKLTASLEDGRVLTRLTDVGTLLGTPDYLAPEQAVDTHGADVRSDIYSLGCTLYYLLTGGPPFTGKNMHEVLVQHQENEAPLLEAVRSDLPADVGDIVRKMMAKKPEDRYQAPQEVAAALAPFACQPPPDATEAAESASPDLELNFGEADLATVDAEEDLSQTVVVHKVEPKAPAEPAAVDPPVSGTEHALVPAPAADVAPAPEPVARSNDSKPPLGRKEETAGVTDGVVAVLVLCVGSIVVVAALVLCLIIVVKVVR